MMPLSAWIPGGRSPRLDLPSSFRFAVTTTCTATLRMLMCKHRREILLTLRDEDSVIAPPDARDPPLPP
jgi:hypothetical protein